MSEQLPDEVNMQIQRFKVICSSIFTRFLRHSELQKAEAKGRLGFKRLVESISVLPFPCQCLLLSSHDPF